MNLIFNFSLALLSVRAQWEDQVTCYVTYDLWLHSWGWCSHS